MQLNRRMMIKGAGGAALALVGGAGYFRVTRSPSTAIEPWALFSPPPADIRLDAFRHAILAPNPHNRQPWLIRLDGNDRATLFCDLDRRLPDTDPFDRQITIGFGTFLELARISAAERGFRIEVEPFPEGQPEPRLDKRPVASIRFTKDQATARDPLFASITKRRTNRELYDPNRSVSAELAAEIAQGTHSIDEKFVAAIRAITVPAITTEIMTPRTFGESIDLMRIGAEAIDARPDGLSLAGPKIEGLKLIGLLDKGAMADPSSAAFKTGLEMQQEISGSIPALFWIATPTNSRIDQLEAGRLYVRANLRATSQGVAMHPLSQALQEYPEMEAKFVAIHKALNVKPGHRLQMLARMGYAPAINPSPRWPLETHLRT